MDREVREPGVSNQPHGRGARVADPARADRGGWLSHGLAALAISALGLAVAGSISLTTSAQTTGDQDSGRPAAPPSAVAAAPVLPRQSASPSVPPGVAAAFARRASGLDSSRSAELQAALVKERAARRSEALAQTAEQVTRAVRDQASAARRSDLNAADRDIQQNAVRLAWARQQRAIAARVAAGNERTTVEKKQPAPSKDPGPSSVPTGGGSASPVPGAVIGAKFGQYGSWARYHTGLDFRAGYGTPIRAVKSGVVLFAGNSGNWAGIHVAVQHAGGLTTMSSHMSATAVRSGQTVQAGQVIGYVGQTGRSFGPHLHFELYPAGVKYGDVYRAVDPLPWLQANGVQTR